MAGTRHRSVPELRCGTHQRGQAALRLKYNFPMLYSVPDLTAITEVPHLSAYQRWREQLDRIDPDAFRRIHEWLDSRFDEHEVDTSSWIPGADWRGTVFQPIYDTCGEDPDAAALFFGLLVWQAVMDREDCWSFGRYEKEGIPIRGMTYFRIDPPGQR